MVVTWEVKRVLGKYKIMHFIQIKENMKKWLHVCTTIDVKITVTERLTSNSHHETALPQCSQRDFLSTHSLSM